MSAPASKMTERAHATAAHWSASYLGFWELRRLSARVADLMRAAERSRFAVKAQRAVARAVVP